MTKMGVVVEACADQGFPNAAMALAHVYAHVYTHVSTHASAHVCMHVRTHVYTHVHAHVHTPAYATYLMRCSGHNGVGR